MATKKSPADKKRSILVGSHTGEADTIWSAIDWSIVAHLVVMVSRAGGTVQLGVTQNGTAATMRLYHNGVGETFYAGDVAGMEDLCRYYAGEFESYLD